MASIPGAPPDMAASGAGGADHAFEVQRPELIEIPVAPITGAFTRPLASFIDEALRRGEDVDCFHFVPCEYLALYTLLDALPRGRFCEWGSGVGVGVALAETLGFEACGIEIHAELAETSRSLLSDFGFRAEIATGSCFDVYREADVYFSYCWPSEFMRVERHFAAAAPDAATLILGHGASDLRCKVKRATRAAARPC